MTPTFILVTLILITRTILEACSEKPRGGYDFLALMNAGVLPLSKKAKGRAQQIKSHRLTKTRR